MKSFKFAALSGLALVALAGAAYGQTVTPAPALDNQVVIEWGNMLSSAALFVASLAGTFVVTLFRQLPAEWAATAKVARIDQLLERAIQYGANTVANASVDKKMSFEVANDVLEAALEYAVSSGPKTLIEWAGGADGLRSKIIARLDVTPETALAPT